MIRMTLGLSKPSRRRPAVLAAAVVLLFLSACGSTPTPSGQVPSSVQSGTPSGTAPAEPPCTPVPGGVPKTIADFNCLNLVSIGGRDASGTLAWLATNPVTVKTSILGGRLTIGGQAACNYYGAPLTVTGTTLTVKADQMTSTAIGCLGEASDREQWTYAFLAMPMNWVVKGQTLVLSNAKGEMILKPATHG